MKRFVEYSDTVVDSFTYLMWKRNASSAEFTMTWREAFDFIKVMNKSKLHGYTDWRLPNRNELFSLVSHETINPSLPINHPFTNVFTGYYWTSTSCCRLPDQAWYIHMGGARVYKGMKHGSYMVWPVRNSDDNKIRIYKTGQHLCYDENGHTIDCKNTGQDGEHQTGNPWVNPQFSKINGTVYDHQTGLTWDRHSSYGAHPLDWEDAFGTVDKMNSKTMHGFNDWRLPSIIELESLTDMGQHSPALPDGHPFDDVQEFYWSSTTSRYDSRYAWVLYMKDGAVGVGFKPLTEFFVRAVRGEFKQFKLTCHFT